MPMRCSGGPASVPTCGSSSSVRRLFARLGDQELETLLEALASEDIQRVIRYTARFNWHGELIRTLLRQPGVKSTLFQTFLR